MAYLEVCDLCKKEIMAKYTDTAIRVKVKRIYNRFDGYVPYRNVREIDVCNKCVNKLIAATPPNKNGE